MFCSTIFLLIKKYVSKFKSPYATDGKYLAVITKWIVDKDKINQNTLIINSEKIEDNYLIEILLVNLTKILSLRNITSKKMILRIMCGKFMIQKYLLIMNINMQNN